MVISFAIVFGLLAKFGFPVITQSVDERRKYIQESLEKADEANRMLESIRQQSEQILSEARKSQQEMIKQATADATRIVQKANDEAVVQGKKRLEESLRMVELQKQKAIGEIRAQVARLSVDIAEKILRNQLSHTEDHDRLITGLLDEIENSDTARN